MTDRFRTDTKTPWMTCECMAIVTTTDLMLHRIANQWSYNLASRSMDLRAVAFPALVAADDGWVQYLSEAEELSV